MTEPAPLIRLSEKVREQLRLALLDEADFLAAVGQSTTRPVPDPPGVYHCRATLPVPRPLDPETAELRELDVFLRQVDDAMVVYALRGLDLASLDD